MIKKKTYKYVIELDRPVWPRKIADSIMWPYGVVYNAKVLSVKDLQYKKHFYGNTYKVGYEDSKKLGKFDKRELFGTIQL